MNDDEYLASVMRLLLRTGLLKLAEGEEDNWRRWTIVHGDTTLCGVSEETYGALRRSLDRRGATPSATIYTPTKK